MKKIILILVLLLTGCSKEIKPITKNLFYMDTLINIKIYETDTKKVDDAINYIDNLYKKYDEITNFYNENSELYKLNNSKQLTISNELYDLIEIGIEYYNKSNGLFNINMGGVSKIWHNFRENPTNLPTEQLNIDISIDNIKLLDNNTIVNNGFNIDLGALVKGYVTELAGNYLEENGLNNYIINAGGNVKVGKSHKGHYTIGIANPNKNESIMTVKGENISVVTSGGYERFYEYNGIFYHHIIDPNTRYPANYMKSVTVIGKDSGLCDILSTTLFLMDIEKGKEFIKDYDVSVIWYTLDDEIIKSEGFNYE